jgi:hypothetical protein
MLRNVTKCEEMLTIRIRIEIKRRYEYVLVSIVQMYYYAAMSICGYAHISIGAYAGMRIGEYPLYAWSRMEKSTRGLDTTLAGP